MAEKIFDIVVAGEINPDLILTGDVLPEFGQVEKLVDNASFTIGSSSVIFACGAARLGLKVAFIGICGDDIFGQYMLTEMGKRSVDISHVLIEKGGKTGFSVILNRETDRAILTYLGLIPALRTGDIPVEIIQQSRHLHIASYFLQTNLQADLPAVFRMVRELGLTTSLDTNYDPSEKWDGFDELLSTTNVFLPNEREVMSLSREGNLVRAAQKVGSRVDILAVKLGPEGALAVQGDKKIQVDSIPVNVVDTIGAGDSFDAGFLFGYLNGWDLGKSLRLACACGGLSTQKAGGTEGQPGLAEALKYVS